MITRSFFIIIVFTFPCAFPAWLLSLAEIQFRARAEFCHLFKRDTRVFGNQSGNDRRTEAALAASHAASGAAFDTVKVARRGIDADSVQNLAFGNALAAADNGAVIGILADNAVFLRRRHFGEPVIGLAAAVESRIPLCGKAGFFQKTDNVFRKRRRTGKTRGFNAAER